MTALSLFALLLVLGPAARATAPLPIVSARASSERPDHQGYSFRAQNLIDGRVDTSWQPQENDTLGVGQWFEVDLGETVAVSAIEADFGLQATDPELGDLFCKYNRPTTLRVIFDDGTWAWLHETDGAKRVRAEARMFHRAEEYLVGEARTRRLRFVVTEAERPVEWDDLAVAEVRVFGAPAADIAPTGGDVRCATPELTPFVLAVTELCATSRQARGEHACTELLDRFLYCHTFVGFTGDDDPSAPYPTGERVRDDVKPIPKARVAAGKVELRWRGWPFTRHTMTLERGDGGVWRVTRHTRRNADGTPPRPSESYTTGRWRANPCWQSLGKTPPPH